MKWNDNEVNLHEIYKIHSKSFSKIININRTHFIYIVTICSWFCYDNFHARNIHTKKKKLLLNAN